MVRFLMTGFLFLAACGSLACGSYTETLVDSPRRVDERVATSTLRSVGQAQTAYSLTNSGDYGTFEQLVAGGHLDARFNSSKPKLYGYFLTMTVSNRSSGGGQSSYHCNADPDPAVNPVGRHFYLGSDSPELRVNPTEPATATDAAFQP
ncbi:MAG: hypothetical protein ND866_20275 [Pyrinomonadaceae bacterium]|nr:hypothetical protein [Pyrinomonadaceae bacterium]